MPNLNQPEQPKTQEAAIQEWLLAWHPDVRILAPSKDGSEDPKQA